LESSSPVLAPEPEPDPVVLPVSVPVPVPVSIPFAFADPLLLWIETDTAAERGERGEAF